jgi:hypothetical protein
MGGGVRVGCKELAAACENEHREGGMQHLGLVSGGLDRVDLGLLRCANRRVVDDAWFDDGLLSAGGRRVLVDSNDDVLSRVDARLSGEQANHDVGGAKGGRAGRGELALAADSSQLCCGGEMPPAF